MPRCFGGLVSSISFATSRSRELWWTPLIGTDGTPGREPPQAFQFLLRARRRGTGEPRAGPRSAPVPAAFASAGPAAGGRAPDRQRLENTTPAWPARELAAPPR